MADSSSSTDRRAFLTGKSALARIQEAASATRQIPASGHTLRLSQRAMACDFSVIMNAGVPRARVQDASSALDLVSDLEQLMSVYRDDSALSLLNRGAAIQPMPVERELFQLLQESTRLSEMTEGAFDPTSGPLVALWRACRDEHRIPTQDEIDACLQIVGTRHVHFDEIRQTIQFDREGVELNLGGIGKGYALDRAGGTLSACGIQDWLLHGGHSSLFARGDHNGLGGWPVGIGNPLFTGKRLGTIVISDCALATSGSNIQYFRHRGKKYGHILDPRTGWPVEKLLSVTVLAPTAAMADALSTAFYVMGVDGIMECCSRLEAVSAVVIPVPEGRDLRPIVLGISSDKLFLDEDQIAG